MKTLEKNQLELINGGCQRWMRRYVRAVKNGLDQDYQDSMLYAFEACIDQKYE